MQFILTAAPDPNRPRSEAEAPPDEKVIAAYMKFNEDMHTAGVLVASEGLSPTGQGARIGIVGGKRTVLEWLLDPVKRAHEVYSRGESGGWEEAVVFRGVEVVPQRRLMLWRSNWPRSGVVAGGPVDLLPSYVTGLHLSPNQTIESDFADSKSLPSKS